MGSLLSYSGLSTKIRAMQSKLIGEAQYQEIAQMDSVPQIVAYLKKQPGFADLWADLDENRLHRGDIEKLLVHTIHQNFTKLYRFANPSQRTFMALYFKRYEIAVMKECLRKVFDQGHAQLDLSLFKEFFDRHSKLDIEKLTSSATVEEFVNHLEGSEYYAPLKKLGNDFKPQIFDYGMALDQYYFANIWSVKEKLFKKRDLEEITRAYGNKFDMLNLQWIYRSKKYYHMQPTDIYALLIPVHYRLSRQEISALVEAPDPEEFRRVLEGTYYKKRFPELAPEKLEEFYTLNLKTILESEARKYPHSVIMIYSYFYHKEHEVDRLTTAIECVRYGLSPAETMDYIHRT
ncbi:MAG TPA: V-type ATPase subunit [Candidatus Blautia merdavium]|uniref:V-type ATPase subunit n=1 Tax=Candidatus Blautia merdavium TaxID=2838494 RepID=A0A9D2TB48_9FIRM|nr:V-type ATPase subunit [Candidatus Blautia merdavium]